MLSIWCFIALCLVPLAASSNIDCGIEYFPCDNGTQCVKRSKWCDGKPDCENESDEAYCRTWKWYEFDKDPNDCKNKANTHILCGSGFCIPVAALCDKYKDCDDGVDEKNCELTTTAAETATEELAKYYDFSSEKTSVRMASTSKASFLTSAETKQSREEEQVPSTSTTRDAFSSGVNGYRPASTSYYDKRMKEADYSETNQHHQTFPKTVPTRAYVITPSAVPSTPKTYPKIYTSTTPRSIPSRRPVPPSANTYPRHNDQQRQIINQHNNHYQPSINHYQLPTNRYQPPANHHQAPFNRYQPPTNHHQIPSNHYQPLTNQHQTPSNRYQPPTDHYQPSSNFDRSSSNHYQSPTHHYPSPNNHYQPPSHTNYNEYRPLNGQPHVRYQTNYFKPYSSELDIKKPFYFAKDYGSLYGRDNVQSIVDGVQWLLKQRSVSEDWGKDTSRAVVALALSNSSFFNGSNEGEIIKRQFMVQIGADLIRNNTKDFNINRMFMAINGLLAVCEDPTDFHGIDLAEQLRNKIQSTREKNNKYRSYQSPFVSLSLCLSNKSLSSSEIHNLMTQMVPRGNMNERTKDTLIAAIMAFSCYVHRSSSEDSNYISSLRTRLRDAVVMLLEQAGDDGSFGSVYSTALAAHALMSTNESNNWDASKTMGFLKQQQREDGSFGDLLATYLALPALNGKSLLHLRNMNCNPAKRELTPKEILETAGPKQYVHYSLYFGYPLVNSQSLFLLLPQGIHFLDVMRVAEYQDPSFRFALENNSSKVYSLSGLPNDSELGLSWHLYVKHESSSYLHDPDRRERFAGDLRSLSPKSGETFIFWYHSNELQ